MNGLLDSQGQVKINVKIPQKLSEPLEQIKSTKQDQQFEQ